MICVLCHPDAIRPGRVRQGMGLPMCAECFARNHWRSRRSENIAELEPVHRVLCERVMIEAAMSEAM
jgi:hypothetical protein